jgi:heme/copper-type cytochrome/quinol oxidase subunit 3
MSHAATADTHAHDAEAPSFRPYGVDMGTFGMWLFLASEIMFFTGLLGAYIVYRISYTTPEIEKDVFALGANSLDWWIGALNTLILIVSSFTMVQACVACEKGNAATLRKMLFITAGLGMLFLCIKVGLEYYPKIYLHGHGPSHSLFFSCYYGLTGAHGVHVFGGVIPLVVLALQSNRLAELRSRRVETLGLYWHFVDVVWIFLFPLLYLAQ